MTAEEFHSEKVLYIIEDRNNLSEHEKKVMQVLYGMGFEVGLLEKHLYSSDIPEDIGLLVLSQGTLAGLGFGLEYSSIPFITDDKLFFKDEECFRKSICSVLKWGY